MQSILGHSDDGSEPRLPTHHVLVSLGSLVKWKLLNHALDVVVLSEVNGLLAVQHLPRGPAVDR